MTSLDVDRLTLRLSGLGSEEAYRLAALVGGELGRAITASTWANVSEARAVIDTRVGESLEALAERIASAANEAVTEAR